MRVYFEGMHRGDPIAVHRLVDPKKSGISGMADKGTKIKAGIPVKKRSDPHFPSGFPGKGKECRTLRVCEDEPVSAYGEGCCPAEGCKIGTLLLHYARAGAVHLC